MMVPSWLEMIFSGVIRFFIGRVSKLRLEKINRMLWKYKIIIGFKRYKFLWGWKFLFLGLLRLIGCLLRPCSCFCRLVCWPSDKLLPLSSKIGFQRCPTLSSFLCDYIIIKILFCAIFNHCKTWFLQMLDIFSIALIYWLQSIRHFFSINGKNWEIR